MERKIVNNDLLRLAHHVSVQILAHFRTSGSHNSLGKALTVFLIPILVPLLSFFILIIMFLLVILKMIASQWQ